MTEKSTKDRLDELRRIALKNAHERDGGISGILPCDIKPIEGEINQLRADIKIKLEEHRAKQIESQRIYDENEYNLLLDDADDAVRDFDYDEAAKFLRKALV